MNWTPASAAPEELIFDRRADSGDVSLAYADGHAWVNVTGHRVVGFPFGDPTSLFDESDLAAHGTRAVFAAPPIAYVLVGEGAFGLLDVTAGAYRSTWVDLTRGEISETVEIVFDGGDEALEAPRPGPMVLALSRVGR